MGQQRHGAAEESKPTHRRPTRRRVLQAAVAVGGGAAAGVAAPAILRRLDQPPPRWQFFTEEEAALVQAICEQIIPADQDPGGRDAGCANFIDRQLAGPYARFQKAYRSGLASVQATSRAMFGSSFETLPWDKQTAVLQAMESNLAPREHWVEQSAGAFFSLVRDHTMQGFYGSPRHGGNRNYASYRMLGLEYPRVLGRNKHSRR